jgi:hypothetical protein
MIGGDRVGELYDQPSDVGAVVRKVRVHVRQALSAHVPIDECRLYQIEDLPEHIAQGVASPSRPADRLPQRPCKGHRVSHPDPDSNGKESCTTGGQD